MDEKPVAPPSAAALPVTAVSVDRLRPAPWDPRTIRDERFQQLCQSIAADPDLLWRRPILAQADGTIYAGNLRYRAAQALGMTSVPALVEDVPDALAREWALKDNHQWGDWVENELALLLKGLDEDGRDLSLLGFEDADLQGLLAAFDLEERHGREETFDVEQTLEEVQQQEPITRRGDCWRLGPHRLLCGDSTDADDVARLMDGQTARLMATDPPYLIDYTGGTHPPSRANRPQIRDKHWDAYKAPETSVAFFASFLRIGLQHLAPASAVYQWHAQRRQALVEQAWRDCGLLVHQQIIWVKARGVLTRSHYMWQHEPCFYGWVEGTPPERKPPSNATTVWTVDQKGEQGGIHPTQKPVELFLRPIEYHTAIGDVCYEPFLGSGTQLIACEKTGRVCYAMELEPSYVDVAVARWESFTGEPAIREEA